MDFCGFGVLFCFRCLWLVVSCVYLYLVNSVAYRVAYIVVLDLLLFVMLFDVVLVILLCYFVCRMVGCFYCLLLILICWMLCRLGWLVCGWRVLWSRGGYLLRMIWFVAVFVFCCLAMWTVDCLCMINLVWWLWYAFVCLLLCVFAWVGCVVISLLCYVDCYSFGWVNNSVACLCLILRLDYCLCLVWLWLFIVNFLGWLLLLFYVVSWVLFVVSLGICIVLGFLYLLFWMFVLMIIVLVYYCFVSVG